MLDIGTDLCRFQRGEHMSTARLLTDAPALASIEQLHEPRLSEDDNVQQPRRLGFEIQHRAQLVDVGLVEVFCLIDDEN